MQVRVSGILTTVVPGKCSKLLATPYPPHVGIHVNHHQYPVIPDEIRMGKTTSKEIQLIKYYHISLSFKFSELNIADHRETVPNRITSTLTYNLLSVEAKFILPSNTYMYR
jgi:hypothetical protein